MSKYINLARKVLGSAMRRGGPMDKKLLRFVCQQCGEHIALSLREVQTGKTLACPKCGPGATFAKA